MKVAVLCESTADAAAIRILLEGILQKRTEAVPALPHIETRPGGWPSVKTLLPTAIKYLYFNTDADALIVVADSDDTPVHQETHETPGGEETGCRLCQLRGIFRQIKLRPVPGRQELKSAIGVAVPAIEAWYLCGQDQHVNEASWSRRLRQLGRISYERNALKKKVYETERPTTEVMLPRAIQAATRLARDLSELERLFPGGFGSLANDVRNW